MPTITSGSIAAVDSAPIDHQSMPCELVWLATITGNVLASSRRQDGGEKILIPGQDKRQDKRGDGAWKSDRKYDAQECSPSRKPVDRRCSLSSSMGIELN